MNKHAAKCCLQTLSAEAAKYKTDPASLSIPMSTIEIGARDQDPRLPRGLGQNLGSRLKPIEIK